MSLLVVGLSHRTAPLELLEKCALATEGVGALQAILARDDDLNGVVVLATCNRLEVYAGALTFHGALTSVTRELARATGVDHDELTEHLYVHYEDRAIAHLFEVASGLDSMAVGEHQILGQLRAAHQFAERSGTLSQEVGTALQRALRVGRRVQADTHIGVLGRSLVDTGLDLAVQTFGSMTEATVLVVGAGGMGALAAATVAKHDPTRLLVVNRTSHRADQVAQRLGGESVPWHQLRRVLSEADIILTSTGALGHVVTLDDLRSARAVRAQRGHTGDQVIVDLALPRDVEPAAATLAGVRVVDLAELGEQLAGLGRPAEAILTQARDLVNAEVAEYRTSRAMQAAGPAVAALRARAAQVVEAELTRFDHKVPGIDEQTRFEAHRMVHRIVEKLLHTPTVRAKALAADGDPGESDYAAVLRELFDIQPADVSAVSTPPCWKPVSSASYSARPTWEISAVDQDGGC